MSGSRYSPPCLRSHRRVISVLFNQKILISEEREVPLSHFNSCFVYGPGRVLGGGGAVGMCFRVWSLDEGGGGSQAHRDGRAKAGFCFGWGSKEACPCRGDI